MQRWILKQNLELNGLVGQRRTAGIKSCISTNTSRTPTGESVSEGDAIFIYESGFIYETGKIVKAYPVKSFGNFEELIEYYHSPSNAYKNPIWWSHEILDKAYLSFNKKSRYYVSVREARTQLLDNPVYVGTKMYAGQNRWQKVDQDFGDLKVDINLDQKIPSPLRLKLLQKYNLIGDACFFDIDHVVPRSLGGPGNIEENLYPLGFGINRNKGNMVPKGLFIVISSEKWKNIFSTILDSIKIPYDFLKIDVGANNHLPSESAKDLAKMLVQHLNNSEIDSGIKREFYREIRAIHYPNFEFNYEN